MNDGRPLLNVRDPLHPPPQGWPVLRLGFRPFYLLAAGYALLAIPFWVLLYAGFPYLHPQEPLLAWHAHEMVFGFVVAVICGFLLTAVKNWTGLPTPKGWTLGLLAILWVLARLGPWLLPLPLLAILDVGFDLLVALLLGRILYKAKSHRNFFVPVVLLLLAAANAMFYACLMRTIGMNWLHPVLVALALIVFLETMIAGRVIPMFTRNAIKGIHQYRLEWLERILPWVSIATLLSWIVMPKGISTAGLALLAGGLHAVRWWGWGPLTTWNKPMLWILHVSYGWLILGFLLLAPAALGWISPLVLIHVWAVGATAGLIMGMITRTAQGHTGRFLQADREEVVAYWAIMLAALLRILPLLFPVLLTHYLLWLIASASCWFTGFLVYEIRYLPWLTSSRIDGQDG